MRFILSCCLFILTNSLFAQDIVPKDSVAVKVDSLYREDQFYISFTYNRLLQAPAGFSQQRFSAGFSGGFLRDMPVNKRRNLAFATGLGITYNNYFENLVITGDKQNPSYAVLDYDDFNTNKFSQFLIDVPIEFRWRTSTPASYRFWRVYGGIKLSYVLYDSSVLKDDTGKLKISNNVDFNKFQYGFYMAAGFNTWNVYGYYGLQDLFKTGAVGPENLSMRTLNFGIIFYIL